MTKGISSHNILVLTKKILAECMIQILTKHTYQHFNFKNAKLDIGFKKIILCPKDLGTLVQAKTLCGNNMYS